MFVYFQPDSEESNEMVFCDQCNICVHQVRVHMVKLAEQSGWTASPMLY